MCGFCGYYVAQQVSSSFEGAANTIVSMMDQIEYRGPDDSGHWLDEACRLALGHRRLSIQDISAAGHQPMHSASDRYVIVFNGEVYNFPEIREAIEKHRGGHVWRGHSDTEIILEAFEIWGMKETLTRMVGMFALALFDKQKRTLYLARDRMGEKPLYYGWQGGSFLFGSELKSMVVHPQWQGKINRDVIVPFLRYNNVPETLSIYQGIQKLMPGTYLQMSLDERNILPGECPQPETYWSVKSAALAGGTENAFKGTPDEAVQELDRLLRQAIQGQMISDVPLGAFLSGGIDSSTVVALMQDMSAGQTRTFSIGFSEAEFNEANHAKAVAEHLGTDHTEMYVTPQQAMDVIPSLPTLFDEPFADPSQIPTFLVSQLAKQHVTVSLSGDAGDELFCGYSRYQTAMRMWDKVAHLPAPLRSALGQGVDFLPAPVLNSLLSLFNPVLNKVHKPYVSPGQIRNLAVFLRAKNVDDIYHYVASIWKNPLNLVKGAKSVSSVFDEQNQIVNDFDPDPRRNFMYLDQLTYLPDDILVKVDRCAMAVSLEGRVPMLDHRVVEFAWTLPTTIKVREGKEKWPLRQVLYQHVPQAMIDRPKMGFGVPIDSWLRKPLRDWAEDLLDESRMRQEGFFHVSPIQEKWREHVAGKSDWSFYLWHVLMFQQWYRARF